MGGHVFNTVTKIRKSRIQPTLEKFKEEIVAIFPQTKPYFKELITLGSVGKKEYSGDIDLAFDENILYNMSAWGINPMKYQDLYKLYKKRARTATDKQIQRRAILQCICDLINENENTSLVANGKSTGNGMFSIEAYQWEDENTRLDERVQIDAMFGNIDWLKFSYYSDVYKGNVKGLHRTQLMVHMFAAKEYSFNHNMGVKKDNVILANTPEECINLINKIYDINLDRNICSNYFLLQDYIKAHLSTEDLHKVYDIYLRTLDSTRCDIPEDLQQYWIDNQERLKLTGKFLPEESNLQKYKICQDQ